MNGFLEITAAILRMGPTANQYGDKFDLSAAIAGDGREATVKALVSPDKLFSRPYMHEAFRLLRDADFHLARYEHEGERFTVDLTHEPFIIRKEHPMSVQHAHQTASAALAAAISEATAANEADLVTALQTLSTAHDAALAVAQDTTSSFADRLTKLVPLAAAVDGVKAAGLAHPDQGHPVHSPAKDALRACAAVAQEVFARELATIA